MSYQTSYSGLRIERREGMKKLLIYSKTIFTLSLLINFLQSFAVKSFVINNEAPKIISPAYFTTNPVGGDTIYILNTRTKGLKFQNFNGNSGTPIVFINLGGQVIINDSLNWGALTFENCKHIKVTGTGPCNSHYGFKLSAQTCGLAFSEYSSDCEAEFIEIDHRGFFGVYAKKDFGGNPPVPYPVFNNLIIHDLNICNVVEGMYLGETKSPGMEFHHVRVYNNLIRNTGREAIQVANMVEDVEVYNNTIMNSGLNNESYQKNNFQIGDNSVGKYYNNVIINSPGYGMIVLGSGNIEITNNYFERNMGVFVDNRLFSTLYAPIEISNNYFTDINNSYVFQNMNEINPIIVYANKYDNKCPFISTSTLSGSNLKVQNNQLAALETIRFADVSSFITASSSLYSGIGITNSGSMTSFNCWPVLDSLKTNYYITANDTLNIPLNANVSDGDQLVFALDSTLSFVSLVNITNGKAKLVCTPKTMNVGTFKLLVSVADVSHQAKDRQMIQLTVKLNDNHIPVFRPINTIIVNNLEETSVPLHVYDQDLNSLILKVASNQDFIAINNVNDTTYNLIIKPRYLETGDYAVILSLTDSYSDPVLCTIPLKVVPKDLEANTPVYRLNCGGPEIIDSNLNWESVYNQGSGKQYVVTHSYETGSHSYKGVNSTTAPANIFGPYSYDYSGGTELQWKFPLPTGKYLVNLFFREQNSDISFDGTKGYFNVALEDSTVLNNFCIYDAAGGELPLQKTFTICVTDGDLNIDFKQIIGKPRISGVEIIYLDKCNKRPEIQNIQDIVVDEGDSIKVALSVTDDFFTQDSKLSYTTRNFPSFVKLDTNSALNPFLLIAPNYSNSGTYSNLIVKVNDGELSDSISFQITVNDKAKPQYPYFNLPALLNLNEGKTDTLKAFVFDPENDPISFSIEGDTFPGIYCDQTTQQIIFTPDYYSSGTYSLTIIASDNKGYTSSQSLQVNIANVEPKILLNSAMIIDEVTGGSTDSPKYLVDEQDLSVELNEHPISKSWKPYYNSTKAPYSTTIDLGQEYSISCICLHDMNNVEPIVISYGEPGNWKSLYTENLNTYKNWKKKEVAINSRYIRLTMQAGSSAYINEVALYGIPVRNTLKSASISKDFLIGNLEKDEVQQEIPTTEIKVFPTIFNDKVNVEIIDSQNTSFNVTFLNSNGQVLAQKVVFSFDFTGKSFDFSDLRLTNGLYFLKVSDNKTIHKTFKLIYSANKS